MTGNKCNVNDALEDCFDNTGRQMIKENIEYKVGSMYSKYPFPKRNKFGVDKMNNDFKENLEKLGLNINDLKGKKVLDAGCGTGELSLFMAKSGAIVEGVDISDGSLNYARKRAEEERLDNISFTKKSLLDGEFPQNYYDYIISHMVLHHTPNAEQSFSNIAKALKPGGRIYIRLFFLWGRMSVFQKSPLWKIWIVRLLGGKLPERKVRIGERLFYKEGHEISHGLEKSTYLYDLYGVPRVTHHTFGEVLRWFKKNNIDYVSSLPQMEFKKLVDQMLFTNRSSITKRGYLLKNSAKIILFFLPLHKTSWAERNGPGSRFLTQLIYMLFFGTDMFHIYGVKRKIN